MATGFRKYCKKNCKHLFIKSMPIGFYSYFCKLHEKYLTHKKQGVYIWHECKKKQFEYVS